ncbi:MAG: hypothetical protein Q7U04_09555 [Bacteriovorax sp.]|nr:hypothetical protein [Bacteriovorax sp.]
MTTKEKKYYLRPNKSTVFMRSFIPWQIYRFIVINIKMLKMMFKSH